jgi:hypothetical protein
MDQASGMGFLGRESVLTRQMENRGGFGHAHGGNPHFLAAYRVETC